MDAGMHQAVNLFPLLIYFAVALLIIGVMFGLSFILGQRHVGRETNEPYESGIKVTGSARIKFTAKFYLVAMLFVIFDLEVVFIFSWAIAAVELGWAGYVVMLVFLGILIAGLIYEWRMGALDWVGREFQKYKRRNIV